MIFSGPRAKTQTVLKSAWVKDLESNPPKKWESTCTRMSRSTPQSHSTAPISTEETAMPV